MVTAPGDQQLGAALGVVTQQLFGAGTQAFVVVQTVLGVFATQNTNAELVNAFCRHRGSNSCSQGGGCQYGSNLACP